MIIYHLQIFCPYMQKHKLFCASEQEAIDKCIALFDEHFPWDVAFKRYSADRVKEIVENGYSIVRINTETTPNYQTLFTEGVSLRYTKIKFREVKSEDKIVPKVGKRRRIMPSADGQGLQPAT